MMQTEIQHVCRKFGGKSVGILLFIDQTGFSPCGEKKVRELEITETLMLSLLSKVL
jgi:hypothetical protein